MKDISCKKINSCEIGFGGGRLLANSAKIFKKAYGIDIHKNFNQTKSFLNRQNLNNYELLHFNDRNKLPKIDFFYSFIVIQHFEKLTILEEYLKLIRSKLKHDGVAVLWYAKLVTKLWGYYHEIPFNKFRKRECSLYIHPEKMEKIVKNNGFNIIKHELFHYKDVINKKGHSDQARITFKIQS